MMKKTIPSHKRLAMGGQGNIPLGYARGGSVKTTSSAKGVASSGIKLAVGGRVAPVAPVRGAMPTPVRGAMPTPVRGAMPTPVRGVTPVRASMPTKPAQMTPISSKVAAPGGGPSGMRDPVIETRTPTPAAKFIPGGARDEVEPTMPIRGTGPTGGGGMPSGIVRGAMPARNDVEPVDTGPISRAPEMMKRGGAVKLDVGARNNAVKNPLTAARAGNGLPGMKSGGKMGGKKC